VSRVDGTGIGRRLLTMAVISCALAAIVAAPALAQKPGSGKPKGTASPAAGSLDTTFGKGGKVTVAFPAETEGDVGVKYDLPYSYNSGHIEMAPAPGGKTVVAGATKMVRYLANGQLDKSFGGGEVRISRPAGRNFVLASVAVDSQGRVLLAGTARQMPSNTTPNPLLSSAILMRFTSNGALDPSFGDGGTLVTDFGLGAPKGAGGSSYISPAVGLRSVVVDSQGRPLISGGYVKEFGDCSGSSQAISIGFVGRLTASGALDPTFGEGGLRQVTDLASFPQVGFTPAGGLLAVGNGGGSCGTHERGPTLELAGMNGEGVLDPNFGFSGFRVIEGLGNAPAVTIAPSGKIDLLGPTHNSREQVKNKKKGKDEPKYTYIPVAEETVTQLLPSGAADPSFSRKGSTQIVHGRDASLSAIAVDAQGRLLLAGRVAKRVAPNSKKNGLTRSSFLVSRVTAKGEIDRSFGNQGEVRTGFGGPASSFATQIVLLNGGRMLVGGGISSPKLASGGGFAIAKYLR
jgi:uncharacterized delta-60 repeat protein